MANSETGYDREQLKAYLAELTQEIAKFDTIENKRPSDIASLKLLHEKYDQTLSQLGESDHEQLAA